MKEIRVISLFLVFGIVFSGMTVAHAELAEMSLFVRVEKTKFFTDEIPVILGTIKDREGNPIQGVNVQVFLSKETVQTLTNNMGSFLLKPTKPLEPAQYVTSVIASKPDYTTMFATVSFSVVERSLLDIDLAKEVQTSVESIPKIVEDGITKNPLSELINRQMEQAKKQQAEAEERRKQISEHQKFIQEQRKLAQSSMENDLKGLEEETKINSPRNAFARFVADFDATIQNIFWGQFALTEKKSQEGHDAKLKALKEGKTSQEAMKIFQRKAAITQKELIEHNAQLNIQEGAADKKIQDQFNSKGKLPRES